MNVPVLSIRIGEQRIGQLFHFDVANAPPIMRFVADESFVLRPQAEVPVLSIGTTDPDPDVQRSMWRDLVSPRFNTTYVAEGRGGRGDWQLPPWFQGLLPEGVFRDYVAREAKCDPADHFRMLAACGKDLPGNVWAVWEEVDRAELQRLVTQDQDALEMNVVSEPNQDAVSVSGVQPKLAVRRDAAGRYVGRTKLEDTHIIAKLPAADWVRMPQVEDLSLRLARAAGVTTCEHVLEPLDKLLAEHDYDLGDEDQPHFLAIERFDRVPGGRVHVETMAQAFNVAPALKYEGATYLDIAALLLSLPLCGEPAVHELLRRLAVNELLGNYDAHLANWGLIYRNGQDAELSPAYDVVAYSAWMGVRGKGHALGLLPADRTTGLSDKRSILSPSTVRRFCDTLDMPSTAAATAIRRTVAAAHKLWPDMIAESGITDAQKKRLLARLEEAPRDKGRPRA